MTTPAERYAASRERQSDPELAAFRGLYDFDFDDFQVDACRALGTGHGVLVAAPTGSGKTVVGEFAVHLALAQGRKCFYTTPIWSGGTTTTRWACSPGTTASTARRRWWL